MYFCLENISNVTVPILALSATFEGKRAKRFINQKLSLINVYQNELQISFLDQDHQGFKIVAPNLRTRDIAHVILVNTPCWRVNLFREVSWRGRGKKIYF